MVEMQNKRFASLTPKAVFRLRVFHRKASGLKSPRCRVKCGCCDEQFEIYYHGDSLEINGVQASVENWREVLVPLLFPDGLPGV